MSSPRALLRVFLKSILPSQGGVAGEGAQRQRQGRRAGKSGYTTVVPEQAPPAPARHQADCVGSDDHVSPEAVGC